MNIDAYYPIGSEKHPDGLAVVNRARRPVMDLEAAMSELVALVDDRNV